MALKLLIFAIHLAFHGAMSAENLTKDNKIPAAWVWKISNANTQAYLVGEIHTFVGLEASEIDFDLGESIFDGVSSVYREAEKLEVTSNAIEQKLSALIGKEMWEKLRAEMHSAINSTNVSEAKKSTLFEAMMVELDSQSPIVAEVSIRNISTINYVKNQIPSPRFEQGLVGRVTRKQALSKNPKKFLYIESNTLTEEVWRENCASQQDAREIVGAALSLFDPSIFWETQKIKTLQSLFKSAYLSSDAGGYFMNYWLANYPGSRTLLRCNIMPRNVAWEKTIKQMLDRENQPVAIFVGIAHLLGKGGLVQRFKNDGTYNVERIFTNLNSSITR